MKHTLFSIASAAALAATGVGCSSSTTTSSGPSSIADLPAATSPVTGSSSALLRKGGGMTHSAATTGINMYNASSTSWPTTGSRASCEAFNMTRELIDGAAKSDLILCYIQQVVNTDTNKAALSAANVTIDDGNEHIFDLDFGDHATHRVKFKITKTDGAIRDFKMYDCVDQGTSQGSYLHQAIGSDGNITIHTVNVHSESGQTNKNQIDVTGALNSSNQFTSKTIVGQNSSTQSGGTFNQKTALTQYSDRIVLAAAGASNFGFGDQSSQLYGEIQLLDSNTSGTIYSLKKLALGEGSGKSKFVGQWGTDAHIVSWNGDTLTNLADATAGTYYASVNAASYPDIVTVTPAFAADEQWSCSGTADATLAVDQTALNTACSDRAAKPDNAGWIDCYTRMGNN